MPDAFESVGVNADKCRGFALLFYFEGNFMLLVKAGIFRGARRGRWKLTNKSNPTSAVIITNSEIPSQGTQCPSSEILFP